MKVYFIGAGPGNPELMTVKAKKILQKAQVVIYAGSLVNPKILEYAPQAEIYNSAGLNLEQVLEIMEKANQTEKIVARVHTGDPGIFGAIQEQIDYLDEKEIKYEVIPGVSSFQAAAAALEREMTLPDVSQTIIITRQPGRTSVPKKEKLHRLAQHNSSMAIFLSVGLLKEVVKELKTEYPLETPVAVVYKASWPEQQIVKGDLSNIAYKVEKAGINKTAMILVGDFIETAYKRSKLYDKKFSHQYRSNNKKAILVASFGTSYAQTRKLTIKACEQKIADSFPEYDIKRAFTSQMIIEKLKERDKIEVDNPREALLKLQTANYSDVIVQPLHIIPGKEFHGLIKVCNDFKSDFNNLIMGEPLFYNNQDYFQVIEVLSAQLPVLKEKEATVFVGHGSSHLANSVYPCLDYVFKDKQYRRVYVGTVEGYPDMDSVIRNLEKENIQKVNLIPLMLVAGDHVKNDLFAKNNSWQSTLADKGFTVEPHCKGLGENHLIQQLYVNKIKKILD